MSNREDKKKYKSDQQKSDINSSLSNFIYSHKTTERWKLFRACLVEEFLSNSIDHILYPEQIEKLRMIPEMPEIIPIDPEETPEEARQREERQKLLRDNWMEECKEHRRRTGEKLFKEFYYST